MNFVESMFKSIFTLFMTIGAAFFCNWIFDVNLRHSLLWFIGSMLGWVINMVRNDIINR
jgi:hypothetical protein